MLAEATRPKEFKIAVKIKKDILVKKSWSAIGTPTFKILPTAPRCLKLSFVI